MSNDQTSEPDYTDPATGKRIVYADNVPELLQGDLSQFSLEDKKWAALDAMHPLERASCGVDDWNSWVQWAENTQNRWLHREDRVDHFYARLKHNFDLDSLNESIDFSAGKTNENSNRFIVEQWDWVGFVFPCAISFLGAEFSRSARFDGAVFCSSADFNHTIFHGPLSFENSKCLISLIFYDSIFLSDANFRRCDVRSFGLSYSLLFGNANFNGAQFGPDFAVRNTLFQRRVDFAACTFKDLASFSGSHFVERTGFRGAQFCSYVDFEYTCFGQFDEQLGIKELPGEFWAQAQASIQATDSSRSVPDFKGTSFAIPPNLGFTKVAVPSLQYGKWRQAVSNIVIIFSHRGKTRDSYAASKLRRLQALANDGHHNLAEKRFFRAELLCRRGHEAHGREALMINMYELFSMCGLSFWRPIFWWSGFAVVFGVLYRCMSPRYNLYGHWQDLVGFTVANSLPLVGIFQSGDSKAASILYGAGGLPFEVGLVAGIHTLISTILLFFALLAIRNYFKLG